MLDPFKSKRLRASFVETELFQKALQLPGKLNSEMSPAECSLYFNCYGSSQYCIKSERDADSNQNRTDAMFDEIAVVCEHLRGQRSEDVQSFQLQLLIFKLMFSTKNMPALQPRAEAVRTCETTADVMNFARQLRP